jgi:hypothetical protein
MQLQRYWKIAFESNLKALRQYLHIVLTAAAAVNTGKINGSLSRRSLLRPRYETVQLYFVGILLYVC